MTNDKPDKTFEVKNRKEDETSASHEHTSSDERAESSGTLPTGHSECRENERSSECSTTQTFDEYPNSLNCLDSDVSADGASCPIGPHSENKTSGSKEIPAKVNSNRKEDKDIDAQNKELTTAIGKDESRKRSSECDDTQALEDIAASINSGESGNSEDFASKSYYVPAVRYIVEENALSKESTTRGKRGDGENLELTDGLQKQRFIVTVTNDDSDKPGIVQIEKDIILEVIQILCNKAKESDYEKREIYRHIIRGLNILVCVLGLGRGNGYLSFDYILFVRAILSNVGRRNEYLKDEKFRIATFTLCPTHTFAMGQVLRLANEGYFYDCIDKTIRCAFCSDVFERGNSDCAHACRLHQTRRHIDSQHQQQNPPDSAAAAAVIALPTPHITYGMSSAGLSTFYFGNTQKVAEHEDRVVSLHSSEELERHTSTERHTTADLRHLISRYFEPKRKGKRCNTSRKREKPRPTSTLERNAHLRSRTLCCVCNARRRNVVFRPCSHIIMCNHCYQRRNPTRCNNCGCCIDEYVITRD